MPIRAVQFHPESIMSLGMGAGHKLVGNIVALTREQVSRNQAI